MPGRLLNRSVQLLTLFALWLAPMTILSMPAEAHHVLGRPAYSLNEDSNTPPGIQGENQIGDYFVTYMVYPAFPKPNEPGRVNVYIKHLDTNASYKGKVVFQTRIDSWQSYIGIDSPLKKLGVQSNDGNVYRQRYVFHANGDYIVRASFEADGQPHVLDIPLRIGPPASFGPIGMIVALLVIVLFSINLVFRRKAMSGKIREAHDLAPDSEPGNET